jgi:hypothetical protein
VSPDAKRVDSGVLRAISSTEQPIRLQFRREAIETLRTLLSLARQGQLRIVGSAEEREQLTQVSRSGRWGDHDRVVIIQVTATTNSRFVVNLLDGKLELLELMDQPAPPPADPAPMPQPPTHPAPLPNPPQPPPHPRPGPRSPRPDSRTTQVQAATVGVAPAPTPPTDPPAQAAPPPRPRPVVPVVVCRGEVDSLDGLKVGSILTLPVARNGFAGLKRLLRLHDERSLGIVCTPVMLLRLRSAAKNNRWQNDNDRRITILITDGYNDHASRELSTIVEQSLTERPKQRG